MRRMHTKTNIAPAAAYANYLSAEQKGRGVILYMLSLCLQLCSYFFIY